MFSYAQNFEDVMLARIFADQSQGFYVDVGAADPDHLSVTKHFYELGWCGINIDPIRSNIQHFEQERPRDINIACAVGCDDKPMQFVEVVGNPALSSTSPDRIDELKSSGHELAMYEVATRTLNSILTEAAVGREIDFLKIDVEGHEESVLRSIDLLRWRPSIIVIEAVKPLDAFPGWNAVDFSSLDNSKSWEEMILRGGYSLVHFDGLNRFYAREDMLSRCKRLEIPPGVFDYIIPDILARAVSSAPLQPASDASDATTLSHSPRTSISEIDTTRDDLDETIADISDNAQTTRSVRSRSRGEDPQIAELKELPLSDQRADLSETSLVDIQQFYQSLSPKEKLFYDQILEKEKIIQEQAQIISALRHKSRSAQVRHYLRKALQIRLGVLSQHPSCPIVLPAHYRVPTTLTSTPTISIVTPSYNQGDFLGRTLDSVLDQKYPSLELFVEDGGSQDTTVDVLRSYDDRVSGWVSERDGGQSDAIDKGFARTKGEIMAWLNSDDILLPGALHYVAQFFNEHPDVDVVYGHRLLIDADDQMIGRWIMPPHRDDILSWADYVPQETLFWRRSLWERAGSRIDTSFRFAMDWDLLLRFRDAGARFARLPRFLGGFRIHEQQKTSAIISGVGYTEMDRLRERALGRIPAQAEIHKAVAPYLMSHVVSDYAWRLRNRLRGRR